MPTIFEYKTCARRLRGCATHCRRLQYRTLLPHPMSERDKRGVSFHTGRWHNAGHCTGLDSAQGWTTQRAGHQTGRAPGRAGRDAQAGQRMGQDKPIGRMRQKAGRCAGPENTQNGNMEHGDMKGPTHKTRQCNPRINQGRGGAHERCIATCPRGHAVRQPLTLVTPVEEAASPGKGARTARGCRGPASGAQRALRTPTGNRLPAQHSSSGLPKRPGRAQRTALRMTPFPRACVSRCSGAVRCQKKCTRWTGHIAPYGRPKKEIASQHSRVGEATVAESRARTLPRDEPQVQTDGRLPPKVAFSCSSQGKIEILSNLLSSSNKLL